MPHVDEGTLHAMLDGELTGQEVAAVQAHLDACARCRARLDEARDFLAEADFLVESLDEPAAPAAPAAPPTGDRSRRPRWLRPQALALAATVTIAAGAGVLGIALRQQAAPPALGQPSLLSEDEASPRPAGAAATDTGAATRDRADLAVSRENAPAPAGPGDDTDRDAAGAAGALEERISRAEPSVGANEAPSGEAQEVRDAADAPARQLAGAAAAGRREAELDAAKPADAAGAGLGDAVQTLGGSIKLIDGRTVLRVERDSAPRLVGAEVRSALVRVVYQDEADREFALEEVRVAFDDAAKARAQAQAPAEPSAAAQQRETSLDFLRVAANDTVISQESDSTVRIRWVDADGFLLALVGHDEAFLRSMMARIR